MKHKVAPKNSKGQFHGYQELYMTNGKLYYRTNVKNNLIIGYNEFHLMSQTRFIIK